MKEILSPRFKEQCLSILDRAFALGIVIEMSALRFAP
jgi:hypothetical protein